MTKGKEKGTKADSRKEGKPSRYINPLTDFGFKYIFGTKEMLIDFLNSIVEDGSIVDLTYDNTERKPHSEEERTARFDLHCTTKTGERIIIEMQNHSQTFFKDRIVFYLTIPIYEQAPKDQDWDYELQPVYSINITNFRMKNEESEESGKSRKSRKTEYANTYISYIQLINRETHEIFYKKLTVVNIELPRFNKKENELQTGAERWTYILKYLSRLNDVPETLRNELFEKLFRMAEIAKLSAEERKEYYRSLKSYRDMNNLIAQRDQAILQSKQVIASLKQENTMFRKEITTFRKENTTFRKEVESQRKMIEALQRQLNMNKQNIN